jgi:sigma-B regulation protein RsbU (phosphoserine phosphatase)
MPTTTITTQPESDPQHRMQCMEVWGGNQIADSGVVMAGLDAWVYSRPYEDADGGGDVYYVSSCATGRISRLLVADVSGHGALVAQTAAELRTLMRKYVNYIDQTQFVRSMNRRFVELGKVGSFATAVVTTFFAPTNDLTLCNAGHPPPLLYRARTRSWQFLERKERVESAAASNIPLGIEDLCDYEQFGVRLAVGDLVMCYTDSLIESHGADGEMLGTAGLLEILSALDAPEPATFIAALVARIESIARGNLRGDDVTVLLFRPNGLGPKPPLRDRLLAPLRVLRGVARSLSGRGEPMPLPDLKLANVGGALIPALSRLWAGGATRPLPPEPSSAESPPEDSSRRE